MSFSCHWPRIRLVRMWILCVLFSGLATGLPATATAGEHQSLFNGRDLTGWQGAPGLWSVVDGAIVGQTSADQPLTANSFLIWQGGETTDIELTASVRFSGVNSGIQYRSAEIAPGSSALLGYQLDLHPKAENYGMLYAEKYEKRGIIALRGQQVLIDADGKKQQTGSLPTMATIDAEQWNSIRILAIGNRLIHQVNGVTTVDVTDNHPAARSSGLIGLQLHVGGPMRAEFKDLKLRTLDAAQQAELLAGLAAAAPPTDSPAASPTPAPAKPKGKGKGKGKANTEPKAESKPEATPVESSANATENSVPPASASEQPAAVTQKASPPDRKRSQITALPGFKVETVYEVPKGEQGSWVSLTVDERGRLYAFDQSKSGLFRIEVGAGPAGTAKVERMPVDISAAQGLAWVNGKLYCFVTLEGIYEVTDQDGDDRVDHARLLSAISGRGEHGNHALVPTGDGRTMWAVAGNHTELPAAGEISRRMTPIPQEDQLLPRQWDPRGHARGVLAPGGWVTKFDPQTGTHELFCAGFRNQYDVALNVHGDMFTFDADMEWDTGLPWYRPTRICHVVSGGEFGWRSGSGKFPAYYEDTLPPLVNIGPGSPTGVVFGTGAKFPTRYQQALFALDWTFGRIVAVHMQPDGAGYRGEAETFLSGSPLPVTDTVIGQDGAMYFTTGGRGTDSALLRVTYEGPDSTAAPTPEKLPAAAQQRRELEAFHGRVDATAVAQAWPFLSSSDRFLRFAARIAIESQPVDSWASLALQTQDSQGSISGAVALARCGNESHRAPLIPKLLSWQLDTLPREQQLGVLRALQLTLIRLGTPTDAERDAIMAYLVPLVPSADADRNTEILRLLVALNADSAVAVGMQMIRERGPAQLPQWDLRDDLKGRYTIDLEELAKNPPPSAAVNHAFILRSARAGWTPAFRREYFEFLNAAAKAPGGQSYPGYLLNTREDMLANCSNAERLALQDITGEDFNPVPDFEILPIQGPGQQWTLPAALDASTAKPSQVPSFEQGRSLYHAAQCGACHRFRGLGGGVGPDLTTVPNKFDARYLLEAIIEPSKIISDQYQSSTALLEDGRIITGLIVPEGPDSVRIFSSDPKSPGEVVPRTQILSLEPSPVSQMPVGLLDKLNPDEVRDLVAYVMSGGDPGNKAYRKAKQK